MSQDLTQSLAPRFDETFVLAAPARVRVSATTAQKLVLAATVPMVAVTLWFGLTSDHLAQPIAEAVYRSYVITAFVAVGVHWWVRRPASRFGALLIWTGVLVWLVSWEASNVPLLFDIGVLAEAAVYAAALYLLLAFPMGRVEPRAARWCLAAVCWGLAIFYVPWVMFAPVITNRAAALTRCSPACPANVLQIASAPGLAKAAGAAVVLVSVLGGIVTLLVYVRRLRTATRPQRRALIPVSVTSLVTIAALLASLIGARILELGPSALDALGLIQVAGRATVPLGFLLALLLADRFAANASRSLLTRLVAKPTPREWRDAVADALDDDELQLGYYEPATGRFVEDDGTELEPPGDPGRRWVPVDHGAQPVAAMVVDETLTEDPELVQAASSATLLAVENGGLEGELRASRARILEAGHAERRRIERDLHDSAQQRLVALRIHLEIAGGKVSHEDREVLDRLGFEVDEAIEELRDVAQGLYPQVLSQAGVGPALKAVATRSAMRVTVADRLPRQPEAVETAVYFCCLECLQNAAKHAGDGAHVAVSLERVNGCVRFSVADDGAGFDPATVRRGAGLTNLEDRLAAVGGTLRIDARPGRGARVTGEVPMTGPE